MVGTVRPSIPVQTILKAINGETEALDAVLRHYSSYIRVLSTRPVKDTYGNKELQKLRLKFRKTADTQQ